MWLLLWAVIDRGAPGRWAEDRLADQAALERIGRGDTAALADLYDRHARPVYSLALRILQNQADAEDIVQEVFAQAWRQAARYDAARGQVAAWLLTLARSRAIDRLRAQRARPEQLADERTVDGMADQAAAADALLVSAEQAARVRAALDELPLLQRIAIELAYYEGLTHTEIAERLEQPLGTVKTRIRTAMTKLRESLAGV
jgi:RNA polymerase sigma-70 factor (ECF subfamily)